MAAGKKAANKESTPEPVDPSAALYKAALELDLARVRHLLAEGASVNAITRGMTALGAASSRAWTDMQVIQTLLDAGADPNMGETDVPLMNALANRRVELISALIKAGADVNWHNANGRTALMVAAERTDGEIIKMMLDAGAKTEPQDNKGRTALALAIEYNNTEAIELLKSATPKSDSSDRPWRSERSKAPGEMRLVQAAEGGDLEYVLRLLRSGADANSADNIGNTALHRAASNGHLDVVDELLKHHARVDVRSDTGVTPLIAAASGGHAEVVSRLLKAGADVKAKGNDGHTSLHANLMSSGSSLAVVELLLSAGADVNAVAKVFGFTPLHWIADAGKRSVTGDGPAIIERLIKAGAKLNIKDQANGWTPFQRAAAHGDLAIVKAFVKLGADVRAEDADGNTPAKLAKGWGDKDVAAYLKGL